MFTFDNVIMMGLLVLTPHLHDIEKCQIAGGLNQSQYSGLVSIHKINIAGNWGNSQPPSVEKLVTIRARITAANWKVYISSGESINLLCVE